MNSNKYAIILGKFHRCSVTLAKNDIIIFTLSTSKFETWTVSRMYPSESIFIDSKKPLILALKTFFKSDVPASVFSNNQYLWSICLGKERVIYPIGMQLNDQKLPRIYATPYFVTDPQIISHYLPGKVHPAYEHVYFYNNAILYLDNYDLPYPDGYYFNECEPTPFYRICFLSDEPIDTVIKLALEWNSRHGISVINYLTTNAIANPKFIDFKPVPEFSLSESNIISTGVIQRKLSSKKPELIIQDILISYYKNISRQINNLDTLNFTHLGIIIEWPILLTFEGTRSSKIENNNRKLVALSINGNHPNHVIYVLHPYDRYIEYNQVPATIWTPISFVYSTLLTDININKVILDTVVIGLVYRGIFFCLSQPLLEGTTTKNAIVNGEYLLSIASTNDIESDPNIQIIESFKYNEHLSLRRVSLKGISLETWCLTTAENTHPYPKNIRLPYLVKDWLNFFMEVGSNSFDVDVSTVRLALTLSKHKICYNLCVANDTTEPIAISDSEVKFNLNERVVQFINNARITKFEKNNNESSCAIS